MVIYYDDILSKLITKGNREGLTSKEMFMLCKLNEWIQNDETAY